MNKSLVSLTLLLALSGCALQPGVTPKGGEPAQKQQSHPRYAPPPGGNAYWDPALGVYVIQGSTKLYYRERVYYRWDRGWNWASSPSGPWQPTDSSGVPAGLGRTIAD
ncbi:MULTISPECIES: hypothetical protein [unclassified Pseudomonas]|uniref:hypothetical protein n=1 Tax=unclassified Pseudomonas TaxID=196821 RepID=UPI00244CE7E5|nr:MULTISPECIES: hypothetical protein [unclassified Pseudomonas]MDG9924837.1 hypothetical protein [Pseudomonas sp. GD04045]MDH0036818.1 hypothetical protein [Pseudomonas sp. GD04019]